MLEYSIAAQKEHKESVAGLTLYEHNRKDFIKYLNKTIIQKSSYKFIFFSIISFKQ